MGEESGRLVGADAVDEELDAGGPSTFTPGAAAPNTFIGGVNTGAPYSEGDPELYTNEFSSGTPSEEFDDMDAVDEDGDLEQTRAQIEQTRAEMSTTIDAIQEKLSPQNIAQQAKDTVKEATVGKAQEMVSNAGDTASQMVNNAGNSAKGFGSNLIETVKANPVPAALAGIGLGWLFMSGRKQSTTSSYDGNYAGQYGPNIRGYNPGRSGQYGYQSYQQSSQQSSGTPLGDRMAGAQDKVGDIAGQAQDKASNVAGQVQDTAGQVAGQVQDTAGQLVDTAQYGAQRAQGAFQQALDSNPLAVGMAAVAIGAAIGLSIPETDKENQLLGEKRDEVMQQAQQTVQEKAQQVQTVAQQAVGAAKDAAQQSADQQGLT